MYSYKYDPTTGGLLLTPTYSDGKISREPRPVYAAELDLFGFDQFWKYQKQNDVPYLWAEASFYYYRGKKVATLRGGTYNEAPRIIFEKDELGNVIKPEPDGKPLKKIDIEKMVKKNTELLTILESATVKKIKSVYEKYAEKLDYFHVAFSGGKDSVVLLALVRKTLPKNSYIVSFANTGMEFPDTYQIIKQAQNDCEKDSIPFFISESKFKPSESWKLFGPPSQVLRWCCHVHKSTPQTLLLRNLTHKPDYKGLAFVGVRHAESSIRSEYDYESYGTKQQGQYSHNPILEWTSAEVWLYIYSEGLSINPAYKKGFSRVGCMCCPMGGGRDYYVKQSCYRDEIEPYLRTIIESDSRDNQDSLTYLTNGGWNSRKNGCYLSNNPEIYKEVISGNNIEIRIKDFKTSWKEWLKPIGDVFEQNGSYVINFKGCDYRFELKDNGEIINQPNVNRYLIQWTEIPTAEGKEFSKLLRYAFRKATYCVQCQTCEVNCKYGCISFDNGLKITNCRHCHECFKIPTGCWAYKSLVIPNERGANMGESKPSLNCYGDHAPKPDWLSEFFNHEGFDFKDNNTLGKMQRPFFKRFIKEAGLIDEKAAHTKLFSLGKSIGWDSSAFLGILLVNLISTSPQFRWYTENLEVGKVYRQSYLVEVLEKLTGNRNAKSIVGSLRRFSENQFGTELHWCKYFKEGGENHYQRTKCVITDYRVVLYALYIFAEKNGNYKDFSLTSLLDNDVVREGISPTRIFGLDREEMIPILNGLSGKYSDFIYASFTHDLNKIVLREDKTSADVLALF